MPCFIVVPVRPNTAVMVFNNLKFTEVLKFVVEFGMEEAELLDPHEYLCSVRVEEGGLQLFDRPVMLLPEVPPPSAWYQ